ncbi:hypothetical protein [Streptomyces sp. GESEQ-35]|uniref:hypothetical protein n=1 Tax=Streptomyces sp. GESEQ-35 TaxID=2812657 RepID=UPI001B338AE4|nr:hypothetical protein [Streptomyces sp. GESEQ-35]
MTTTQAPPYDHWTEISPELAQRVPFTHPANAELINAVRTSTLTPAQVSLPAAAEGVSGVTVRAFWWGFHVEIDHPSLESILNSADAVNALVGMIGGAIPSPAQPWIVLAAQFVAGAHQLLRSLDRGQGIYISMSWFAPGVFVPTSV